MKRKLAKALAVLSALVMVFTLGACGGEKEPSNIIIKNAAVYTVDGEGSTAEAVVVKDGIIEYVGDEEKAMEYEDGDSKVIDAEGNTVLPGTFDSHMHPAQSAIAYCFEIGLQDVFSHEEYLQAIEGFIEENPDLEVYTGSGFMRSFYDSVGPRKEALDKICDDKPIMITSADGHSMWVNSKAMELAGITKDTENPEGGVILRNPETGEPAGLLQESATELVADLAPEMGSVEELEAIIDKGMELSEGFTTGYFQVNAFKFFSDQVLEEGTAYIDGEYSEEYGGGSGIKVWDDETLLTLFTKIDKAGYQIHVHQIGNAAATYVLDTMEQVREANGNMDTRHTLAHVQYMSEENIARTAELNVNAIIAPYWFARDDYYYDIYVPAVGQEAADMMYPAQSLVDAGINIATHSDFFVTEPDLGWLYYGAVVRNIPQKIADLWYDGDPAYVRTTDPDKTAEDDEYIIGPLKPYDEAMEPADIVKASTYGGAYSLFMEGELGSIEKGKKADLLILDQNIFESDIEKVADLVVKTTIFDGKIVYGGEEK